MQALPDGDLGIPVDPRGQPQTSFEPFGRQRPQQRLLGGEVLPDRGQPMPDPTVIITPVRRIEPGVQFRQAIHLGHRHQMGAAGVSGSYGLSGAGTALEPL